MGFPMKSPFSHGFSHEIHHFPLIIVALGPRASLPDVAPVTLAHTGRRVGRVGRVGPKDGR